MLPVTQDTFIFCKEISLLNVQQWLAHKSYKPTAQTENEATLFPGNEVENET